MAGEILSIDSGRATTGELDAAGVSRLRQIVLRLSDFAAYVIGDAGHPDQRWPSRAVLNELTRPVVPDTPHIWYD